MKRLHKASSKMSAKYLTSHPRLIIALAVATLLLLVSFGFASAAPAKFHIGHFIPSGKPPAPPKSKDDFPPHAPAESEHIETSQPLHNGVSHTPGPRHDGLLNDATNATLGVGITALALLCLVPD